MEICTSQAQENAEKKHAAAAQAARVAAVEELAGMIEEPRKLWQAAVDLIRRFTTATGAYVANIVDEEQPDWSPAEDAENPDAETDDEGPSAAAEGEAGEGAAGEEAQLEEGDTAEGEPEEVTAAAAVQARPDYSKKLLTYVAASSGQEFVCERELRRPAPPAEDAESTATPAQVPITFRVLDELIPLLEVRKLHTRLLMYLLCLPCVMSELASLLSAEGLVRICVSSQL